MRNSGSYQLVSKHSILSARRENRAAAGAPRTRRQRLEAYGEWVRQIGTTRESDRCNDGNTTAPDFKVYDRGRRKIEGANSRQIREEEKETKRRPHAEIESEHLIPGAQRDTARKKMECRAESLENRMDAVDLRVERMAKSLEELKAMMAELKDLDRDAGKEESKPEGDEIGGDIEPPREQSKIEAQREEEGPPKEPKPVEGLTTEGSPATANRLAAPVLSLATEACEKEEWKEKVEAESTPEEENRNGSDRKSTATAPGGGTVAEARTSCDVGDEVLSFTMKLRNGRGMDIRAESFSREVDPAVFSLGQAQVKVSKSDSFDIKREVSEEKGEVLKANAAKENELFGFSGSQRKVDLTFNPMGRTHNSITTPTIFTNTDSIDVPSQALLHVPLPTASHCISIFTLPLQNSLVISLLHDHLLSSMLAIKRLEQFSLATILLAVKDGNGLSNSFRLLFHGVSKMIKWLVGVGFGPLINTSILLMFPLIRKWDPGGIQQGKRDMNGVQLYVAENITCKLGDIFSYSALYFIANTITNQRYYIYHDTAPSSKRVQLFHIDEDPSLVELLFQYGRLLFFSSHPGTQVTNLQGIWNKVLEPAWDAQHLNSNLQINYELFLSGNLHECQEPLFDYSSSLSMEGGKTTKVNYVAKGRDYSATNPSESLVTLETLMGGGALFVTILNLLWGGIKTSLDWIPGQDRGVESQVWSHINPCVQIEYGNSNEAIDLLYEWFMDFVGDSTTTRENKLMEFLDKDEDKNSGIAKFESHKLIVEHFDTGESTRMEVAKAHHKQWDPVDRCSTSCIVGTSSFKLWDPGGRLLTVRFRYLHLEDKVNV